MGHILPLLRHYKCRICLDNHCPRQVGCVFVIAWLVCAAATSISYTLKATFVSHQPHSQVIGSPTPVMRSWVKSSKWATTYSIFVLVTVLYYNMAPIASLQEYSPLADRALPAITICASVEAFLVRNQLAEDGARRCYYMSSNSSASRQE